MAQDDWKSLLQQAAQLRQAGRVFEAIDAYHRVLAVRPDLADSWYNLGFLQRQARQFEQALASYDRALAARVQGEEEVHLNKAVILADFLRRPADAEAELRAALSKNPRYVPALLNLGNLLEDLGDREGAREAYRRALDADPSSSLALARLAGLSHKAELDEELAAKLRATLSSPDLRAAEKADLGYALAGLLDAAGHYDEAFAAAADANAVSAQAAGVRYDKGAAERYFDRLIAAAPAPSRDRSDAPAPLFICGMFRSGSTLLEQLLGGHSGVVTSGELDAIPALAASIRPYPEALTDADEPMIAKWREAYLAALPQRPDRGLIVTDKRPDNFLHVGLIKAMFPRAKILHTRRNPLDNLISLHFLHLDPGMSYALNLEDAAHWHAQHERLMQHWKRQFPEDIMEVDYERVVTEPREAIGDVLNFLGLDWEDTVMDFQHRHSAVKTASVWQVRQPLHTRSSGRWRHYRKQLEASVPELVRASGG